MKTIGVTGGVGSGKSQVLSYIESHYRARVLLADEAARRLQAPGGPCYGPVLALLEEADGDGPLTGPDGSILREEMAARIFRDSDLLTKINGIVHPAVCRHILEEIDRARAEGVADFFVLEAALLIETGFTDKLDSMWYIYCDPGERERRLSLSRGYSPEKTERIMKAQLSDDAFRKACRVVIDNSGSFADTCAQVDRALAEMGA